MSKLESIKPQIYKAADIALKYYGNVEREEKEIGNFVTIADREVQEYLKLEILKHFPEDGFIGEEGGDVTSKSGDLWVIDPIDGTADFANFLPSWGISIGLIRDSKVVEATVYLPVINRFYHAELGKGSFLNGTRSKIKTGEFNKGNYFATNAGSHLILNMNLNLRMTTFPSALNPCFVSDGSVLGSISPPFYIWDLAAASLIATEAGAKVEYLHGGEFKVSDLLQDYLAKDFILFGGQEFIDYARKNCSVKSK